jgi:hypothetical protein
MEDPPSAHGGRGDDFPSGLDASGERDGASMSGEPGDREARLTSGLATGRGSDGDNAQRATRPPTVFGEHSGGRPARVGDYGYASLAGGQITPCMRPSFQRESPRSRPRRPEAGARVKVERRDGKQLIVVDIRALPARRPQSQIRKCRCETGDVLPWASTSQKRLFI